MKATTSLNNDTVFTDVGKHVPDVQGLVAKSIRYIVLIFITPFLHVSKEALIWKWGQRTRKTARWVKPNTVMPAFQRKGEG